MTTCIVVAMLAVSQATDAKSGDRYALPKTAPPAVIREKSAPPETRTPLRTTPLRTTPPITTPVETPKSAFPPQKPSYDLTPKSGDTIKPAPPSKVNSQLIPVRPSSSLAADLLNRSLALPEDRALPGRSVGLVELLAAKETVGGHHVQLVHAYWKLTKEVAQYHFSVLESERLAQVDRSPQASQLTMASAQADAAALVQQDKLAAVEAQHALADLMDLPTDGVLPLPADRPLVGGYRTYYEAIFARRMDSPVQQRMARRLHDTLPIMHQALRARAAAVQAADDLVIATLISAERGETHHGTLIARHTKLREQRQRFLLDVLKYNQAIAQYAVIAARPGSQPADLLRMLIKVPAMTSAPTPRDRAPQVKAEIPGAVLPATALETEPGQVVPAAEPPATFKAPSTEQPPPTTQSPGPETQQPPGLFVPPTGAGQPRPLRSVVVPPRNLP